MREVKSFILLELRPIAFIAAPELFLFRQSFKLPCLIAMAFLIKSQGYVVVCEGRLICSCLHLSQCQISSIYLPNEKIEEAGAGLVDICLFAGQISVNLRLATEPRSMPRRSSETLWITKDNNEQFFPLKLPMYKVTGSCKCCCMRNSVLYVSFSAFEFICSIFILVTFCRNGSLIYVLRIVKSSASMSCFLFTRFSFTHLLPGEQPFSGAGGWHCEQGDNYSNRGQRFQPFCWQASVLLQRKSKKKSRIPASWYLSFSSDLPARGQAEYTHNDQ